MLLRIAPLLFVLLWSTGFIASKVGASYAEPFTFLIVRFVAVICVLAPFVARLPQPPRASRRDAAIAGMLIHTAYLGGVL
ncbi:MAG: EamA family transporter, partial [Hyphomicrobiaceae bacterium]